MLSTTSETTRQRTVEVPGQSEPGGQPSALVELRGATRRYGRLVALRGVTLTIEPGEFVFVIGPSEAGKTTLLKLIHGDLRPHRGSVRVDRHRLDRRWRRGMTRLRREVAAVFQDHRLLSDMTARGNVAFALQVADLAMPNAEVRARAQAHLQEVGLGGRPSAYPHQLSGGQQRRLAIARALGHDPVLLLADEPTANLDRVNAERVLELLERRCAAGTTVVVATHDLDLALTRPHRVIELREGRIVADRPARVGPLGNGTAAALLAARRQRKPGLRDHTGRLMRVVLGYTPPPPPAAPRRKLSVRVRAGQVAQFLLGYETPPRPRSRRALAAAAATAATAVSAGWTAPAEVLERLTAPAENGSNGSNGGHANGHASGVAFSDANGLVNGDANGHGNGHASWRPPEPLAPLSSALPVPAGARRPAPGWLRLRERAGRLARFALGYLPLPPLPPAPRVRLGERIGGVMRVVLGYTPPPARPRRVRPVGAALPRRPWTPVFNLGRLAVGGAVASWLRNFRLAAPALGSITLLLLLAGMLTVAGSAVRSLLITQSAEASVLHVYLSDDASSDDVDQSRQDLAQLPHVRGVTYVSKDQALADARQRPGLGDLASLSDSNPFPASLVVDVDSPSDVAAVAQAAANEPAVDSRQPTSYDAGTYDRLRQFTLIAAAVAGGFGLLLLVVTYVISSNSIRSAVLARRDELLTMQLVGASPWLIRTRLGVEGALTGGLAGLLAVALVAGMCLAVIAAERQLFVEVLPGLTVSAAAEAFAGVAALGIALGTISAVFAFRRLRT
jgi:cell division transport system ATP-binding protein